MRARLLGLLLLLALAGAAYVLAEHAPMPAAPAALPPRPEGLLRVHYVDVGQGDGVVWELPGGAIVLYDCGPPADDFDANPMATYVRDTLGLAPGATLHALVSSHGHLDHVGGCEEILDAYRIEHIAETWYEGPDAPQSYQRFLEQARAEGATLHTLATTLAPGSLLPAPGVDARLRWPPAFPTGGWDEIADASLVVRLAHGATAFCFQGDIGTEVERILADDATDARCDAYLVGHHGSRHASFAPWLARMAPTLAIASFGENAYGHPTADALCRVQQAGATVYATERGSVVLASDGARVRVEQGTPDTRDFCAVGATYWA